MNDQKIEWRAPELEFSLENSSWFWISLPVSLVLVAFSLWQKNFLFALLIVVSEISLFFLAGSDREEFSFSLDKDGLRIEKKLFSWDSFENFSIDEEKKERSFLYFSKKHFSISSLRVPVETKDIEKIRVFLNNYLTEKEHQPSLSEEISKFLGF